MFLEEFYKFALTSVGYTLDEDNFMVKKTADGQTREMHNKKQIMLYDGSTRLTSADEVIIFNPLEEDSIKGINPSMVKYKAIIDKRLSFSFNQTLELLATLAANIDLQKKASLELNRFMSELNKLRRPNMKEIVDESFVKLLKNINEQSYTKSSNNGSVFIKTDKGKVIDGEKYNKSGVVSFPIYEDLKENPKEIYDIEFKRNKDVNIYFSLVEFVVGVTDDDKLDIDKYTVGSNSMTSPTFIIIYKLYFKMARRLNSLLKSLEFIDDAKANKAIMKLTLTIEDLAEIDTFAGELKMIPNLNNQAVRAQTTVSREPVSTISAMPMQNRYVAPNGRPGLALEYEEEVAINRPLTAAEKLRKANGLPVDNNTQRTISRPVSREEVYARPRLVPASEMSRVAPGLRREPPGRAPTINQRPGLELPGDNRRAFSPFKRERFNY